MKNSAVGSNCRRILASIALAGFVVWGSACSSSSPEAGVVTPVTQNAPTRISPQDFPVDHIVVLVLENHTFDALYGEFPGVNGLQSPGAVIPQLDENDVEYVTFPATPDSRYPSDLPNSPFLISDYYNLDEIVPGQVHRFYQNIMQMNGEPTGDGETFTNWQLNKFVAVDGTAASMGHWDSSLLPLEPYARDYVLMDNFFVGTFGGSMFGHIWLIGAQPMIWPDAPDNVRLQPQFAPDGRLTGLNNSQGFVTPDGFVVEDWAPYFTPTIDSIPPAKRIPPQEHSTVGDQLTSAGVSWGWYAQGWDEAVAGNPPDGFQVHHQPFSYFGQFAPGTPQRSHLRDMDDFEASLSKGTMPSVAFLKPVGGLDEHPGESPVGPSEEQVVEVIELIRQSPFWDSTAIFVTYDDFGGYYDHVPPPTVDRWGPGGRIPVILISPHAKKNFVDSTLYDNTSILRFIEWRFGLVRSGTREANLPFNAFDL